MKKIFTKGKVTATVMILALAAAVVLNMKYSGSSKFLGEAKYVSENQNSETVMETSAKAESDYLENQRAERDKAYTDAAENLNEILKNADTTDEQKLSVMEKAKELAQNKTDEASIETLLSAKNFINPLVILGDGNATVIVKGDTLSNGETLQITDAVLSVVKIETENIKIVAVNG